MVDHELKGKLEILCQTCLTFSNFNKINIMGLSIMGRSRVFGLHRSNGGNVAFTCWQILLGSFSYLRMVVSYRIWFEINTK